MPAAVKQTGATASTGVDAKVAPSSETHKTSKTQRVHIADTPLTWGNFHKHINYLNTTLILVVPLVGLVTALYTPLRLPTAIFAVWWYFQTGLGITAGYHRLWSHCSYSATTPLRIWLALTGAGAVQGSLKWWAAGHRAHHRYTDTTADPYSVRKGLLYSHLGWMVFKQNPKRIGRSDISDLRADWVVRWQHQYYLPLVIAMGLVFPTLVAGLGWGDYWGGFIYGGILRAFFVQQATFCVNSLAHWLGDQPFDDRDSPRDHVFTALITLGEGYHNFHHEFPSDYRNALEFWQYDPTKWCIWTWKQLGLAYDLKEFRANEIEKGRLQQLQKKLDQRRTKLDWGVALDQLPVVDWDDYVDRSKAGEKLICIAGVIHDVTDFEDKHPGGRLMLRSMYGKDATAAFNGSVYLHHNAAHNLLSTMRVGVVRGGGEVEIWKRAARENKDVEYVKDGQGNKIVRAGMQVTRTTEPGIMSPAA